MLRVGGVRVYKDLGVQLLLQHEAKEDDGLVSSRLHSVSFPISVMGCKRPSNRKLALALTSSRRLACD